MFLWDKLVLVQFWGALNSVMDSDTLALLYFIVILLIMVNGSRAAAPKGTMFFIKTSISTPSDLEAGGQRLEARGWRPEAGGQRLEATSGG